MRAAHSSTPMSAGRPSVTDQAEYRQAVLRKVTRRFLPLLGLCYIVLYLDRSNVGVAALTMNKDLGLSANAFGFAAGVYFWSYTVCELPSNYLLSRVGARVWIPRIMISWGVVTIATAAVQGQLSLSIMRLVLGVAEAGFSPGILYFMTCWYPRKERGRAYSWIVTFICLGGIGTPLSTELLRLDGVGGLQGWRWMFLLTGVPAIICGVACAVVLRDRPSDANFLNPDERLWLTAVLEREELPTERPHTFVRGILNPKVGLLTVVFLTITFSLNGYSLWMPQIFKTFGLGTQQIGWVSVIPPLAAIPAVIFWSRHSDRVGERRQHFAAAALVSALGFAIAAATLHHPVIAVAGFTIAAIGLYTSMAIFLVLPSNVLGGVAVAAGFGLINGFGNLGGYFGPQVTGWLKTSTGNFSAAVYAFAVAMFLGSLLVQLLGIRGRRRSTPAATGTTAPLATDTSTSSAVSTPVGRSSSEEPVR